MHEALLQSIHGIIRFYNYRLPTEVLEQTDQVILPYLEEEVAPKLTMPVVQEAHNKIVFQDKIVYQAALRYYAITQNNLSLYERLEKEGFPFYEYGKKIPLFAFEQILSSKFQEDEYISFLKNNGPCIRQFMMSIQSDSMEEREKCTSDFAEIIRKDPTIMNVGKTSIGGYSLLTGRHIELLGKDFLIQSSSYQRFIINSMYGRIDEKNAPKLLELFQKYPNYHPTLPFYSEFLDYFTVDELGTMSRKDEALYLKARGKNLLFRMKEILSLKPDFDCPDRFIREEIFRVLDNDTIVQLSDRGLTEISNISMPEVENVLIFPVKKINYLVFQDKLRQKKQMLENKEFHK